MRAAAATSGRAAGCRYGVRIALGGAGASGALAVACVGLIAGVGALALPHTGRPQQTVEVAGPSAGPFGPAVAVRLPSLDADRAARPRTERAVSDVSRTRRGAGERSGGGPHTPAGGSASVAPGSGPAAPHTTPTNPAPGGGSGGDPQAPSSNDVPIELPTPALPEPPPPSLPSLPSGPPSVPALPSLPTVEIPDPGAVTSLVPTP